MWLLLIIATASGSLTTIEVDNKKSCQQLKTKIESYYQSEFGDLAKVAMRFKCVEK